MKENNINCCYCCCCCWWWWKQIVVCLRGRKPRETEENYKTRNFMTFILITYY